MFRGCVMLGALALMGCTAYGELSSGYVHSVTGHPGRQGLGLHASAGYGSGDSGIGVSSRARITEAVQQVGAGTHLFLLEGESPIWYGRLGMDAFQIGRVDERFNVNVASPYFDWGVFALGWMSLSLTVQYDWRLSDAGNDVWLGALFGIGRAERVRW
ncbi:MAG: hypothetical protein KIT72_12420 [Polyangiaceae bacterium]|nr:hypothetical protein [Polyangiaceae bacterium]MCW5791218.1 hypothetical protein [Polyangiaceae bacterium]